MKSYIMKLGVIFSVSVILSGCSTVTTLPDGQLSAMATHDNQFRSQLRILPLPLELSFYKPMRSCSFLETRTPFEGVSTQSQFALSIKEVEGKLLVISNGKGNTSTALIGRTGKLFDFNAAEPTTGERVTPESYRKYADQQIDEIYSKRDSRVSNVHVVNEFTLGIPEYTKLRAKLGDIVAYIYSEDGLIWGTYRYRGIIQFHGGKAALLDLTRVTRSNPERGPILVGYNIFDIRNMLPLIVVLDSGYRYRMEQISCSSNERLSWLSP